MNIALITTDRKRGGIAVAFINYLDSIRSMADGVVTYAPAKSHLLSILKDRAFPDVQIIELSPVQIKMLKWGFLPGALRKSLQTCSVIISHNNFLCHPLSKSNIPVIGICHSDKPTGLEYADRIIALSTSGAKSLVDAGLKAEKIQCLPHYYVPIAQENRYQPCPTGPLIVVAAGRLVKKKGFEDFIDAAALLGPRYGDKVEFWLAGEGELMDPLHQHATATSSPVKFKGWVDIKALIAQTSIFCLPSHAEPFGYVLSEFMDFGVPCVSTDTNGPLDILNSDQAGVIYPKGDANQLAEKLAALIDFENDRRDLSSRAFARIREPDFSKEKFEERLKNIITSTLLFCP
jgi:glycosyltransferase involved in cell wall biosynthesis